MRRGYVARPAKSFARSYNQGKETAEAYKGDDVVEPSAAPTLRTLLDHAELRLSLITPKDALAPDALDRGVLDKPVQWVHNSDLIDPTPFLSDGLLLLTTGSQLGEHDGRAAAEYVARLVRRGVLALGFGSGVHRQGVPDELIAACTEIGLALFEVPYDIPFLAVARVHAGAIAAHAYARRTWALEAHRALAVAALRPRGLEAAMSELSRRLGFWVGLFDASGALAHQHPSSDTDHTDAVAREVTALLSRGGSASRTIEDGLDTFTIFTLGRTGQLRGALAIAAAALDPEARAVVSSVIAMAGLALEQNEHLARARRRLRTQVLTTLLTDDPAPARRVLGSLPPAPVVVAVAETDRPGPVIDWWDRADGAPFIAESPEGLVICLGAAQTGILDQLAGRFALRVGVSDAVDYAAFSRAHAQALTAVRRGGAGVTRYADATAGGVLDALGTEEARLLARSRLAPLHAKHPATGADLERTLRVWLEHDAHSERTAVALGIHRHTLRTRLAQAASLLETDLSSFPARAELWAALHAAGSEV
jgi:purine catabolism regulator